MDMIEFLQSMKGKTIEAVCADMEFSDGARNVDLFFTDGTRATFYPSISFHGNEEHPSTATLVVEETE